MFISLGDSLRVATEIKEGEDVSIRGSCPLSKQEWKTNYRSGGGTHLKPKVFVEGKTRKVKHRKEDTDDDHQRQPLVFPHRVVT